MTLPIHSPIRSPLRSPIYSPMAWEWDVDAATAWSTILDSLQVESDGAIWYFTDPDYPRELIRDTTTPVNNVDRDANTGLTYGSPSAKWVRNAAGLFVSGTALRCHYDVDGTPLGLHHEDARTELTLYNRDFTNAAWTKSNMTAAKTATGIDGATNSASTLTATAGNATVLQAITSSSAARITACRIKRRTGTGNIDLTQDNGSTWTTVTVTSSWTRVNIASVTSTNPTVGIRIVTSGDAIDVDFFTHQVGAVLTSDIATTSATVTRAADNISKATSGFPWSDTNGMFVISAISKSVSGLGYLWEVYKDGSNRIQNYRSGTGLVMSNVVGGAQDVNAAVGSISADTAYKMASVYKANDFSASDNGSAATTDATATLSTGYSSLTFGRTQSSSYETMWIRYIKYLPRRVSDADIALESA